MMLKYNKVIPILFALFINVTAAHAAISPISLSGLPPVQFPPEEFSVTGVRASIFWGKHRALYGLDLGLIGNISENEFVGVAASGIFNVTKGTTSVLGLQFAGVANVNIQKTSVYGLQLAGILNSNVAESKVVGLQAALIANLAEHTNVYGMQIGLFNHAQEVYGVQIGLINIASNLHGLQLGLANFNEKGLFAIAPFLNIGF